MQKSVLVTKHNVITSCFDSSPVVHVNLVPQVCAWACSWQCVNLLVMYLAGKVREHPYRMFLWIYFYITVVQCLFKNSLYRCKFHRVWSWNKTSSGRCPFGQTNNHIYIMIKNFWPSFKEIVCSTEKGNCAHYLLPHKLSQIFMVFFILLNTLIKNIYFEKKTVK